MIRVRRGKKATIPTFQEAEFGLITDEERLCIGTKSGNRGIAWQDEVNAAATTANENSAAIALQATRDKGLLVNDKQCIVSFVADDSPSSDYTVLKPIFYAESVPCCIAVITSTVAWPNSYWDSFKEAGWEFGSHTVTHRDLATLTANEIDTELKNSQEFIKEKGYSCNFVVYPQNSSNGTVRKTAKKYYNFGITGHNRVNDYPVETFGVTRVAMGSYTDPGNNTLAFYKSKVDEASSKKAWLIFMLHSSSAEFDATQQGYLTQLIQYIKSLNIPIKTVSDAYAILGNDITLGDDSDHSADFFSVSKTGTTRSNGFYAYIGTNQATPTTPAVNFPSNKITITEINNAGATGFPEGRAGLLITNKAASYSDIGYAYQEYHIYNYNRVYRRNCNTADSSWAAWHQLPLISTKVSIQTQSWPAVPANGYYEKDITITDSSVSILYADTVIFNTRGYFEIGIIPIIAMKADNVIKVRLQNVTGSPITPANRIIYATVLKDLAVYTPTVTGN